MSKIYKKIQDVTYLDILIITFLTCVVAMVLFIIYFCVTDIALNGDSPDAILILSKDIGYTILICISSCIISSAILSIVLREIRKAKNKIDNKE